MWCLLAVMLVTYIYIVVKLRREVRCSKYKKVYKKCLKNKKKGVKHFVGRLTMQNAAPNRILIGCMVNLLVSAGKLVSLNWASWFSLSEATCNVASLNKLNFYHLIMFVAKSFSLHEQINSSVENGL